jgi:hypothetical protein
MNNVLKHPGIGFAVVGSLLFLVSCRPTTSPGPATTAHGTTATTANVPASTTGPTPAAAGIQVVTVHVPELRERLDVS